MEYLRTDTVSVGTLYRKDAKLSRGAGAYFCKHFVPAGAQGGGRLPTLPLRCSQGGLPSLPPAYPAFPDAAGGGLAVLVACQPCFSFAFFPPSPRPRSQSALPGGKGETLGYFMQGASPLASPGAEPQLHWLSLPRGRGPSQTPPSLATDSSISPGPPSPWLPALPIENRFLSFLRRTASSLRGVPAWQRL